MKGFNRFLGVTAGVLFIALIVSVGIIGIYVSSHQEELSEFTGINFHFGDFNNIDLFDSERSSLYERMVLQQEDEFDLMPNIDIDASFEDIEFIEKDRENIKVVYYKEKPDTKLYQTEYNAKTNNKKI